MRPWMSWTLPNSSAIIPPPLHILLYFPVPLKNCFSVLGPSSSCFLFLLVSFETCFRSHFCKNLVQVPLCASTALQACFFHYTYHFVTECNDLFRSFSPLLDCQPPEGGDYILLILVSPTQAQYLAFSKTEMKLIVPGPGSRYPETNPIDDSCIRNRFPQP